jgi:flagellar hook-length control protein FliK
VPATGEGEPATEGARSARATKGSAGAQQQPAASKAAAAQAPFSLALAQLRTAPATNTSLAGVALAAEACEAGQAGEAPAGNEPKGTQEDQPDAAQAGDAASAALAAVLQWLQPVRATHPGDLAGGDAGADTGGERGGDPAAAGAAASVGGVALGAQVDALGTLATGTRAPAMAGKSPAAPAADGAQGAGAAGSLVAADASASAQGFDALAGAIRTTAALADAARASDVPPRQDGDAAAAGAAAGAAAPVGTGADLAGAWRAGAGAAPQPAERTVPVPMHDRHWPQAVAGQVLVLTDQRIDSATLRLSPEHLGPVEVHIDLQGQGVNVSFGAEHAETRSALEQALPQLRAAFAGAGLTLGQATVQQHMRRESQNAQPAAQASGASADHLEVSPAVVRALGLVDEYA